MTNRKVILLHPNNSGKIYNFVTFTSNPDVIKEYSNKDIDGSTFIVADILSESATDKDIVLTINVFHKGIGPNTLRWFDIHHGFKIKELQF